jgi:hypothetical protein
MFMETGDRYPEALSDSPRSWSNDLAMVV